MSQGDEHARLLESVTGLMEKMPLEEEEVSSVSMEQEGGGEGEDAASTGVDKLAAAEYLGLWNGNRKKWSFKKKTQYWLLQNMYDKKKASLNVFCRESCLLFSVGLNILYTGLEVQFQADVEVP